MAETRLTSLSVTGFRNYASGQLDIAASNVLMLGPNGAGKTTFAREFLPVSYTHLRAHETP